MGIISKKRSKAKAGYYEMFYPPSEKWGTNALNISLEMFESVWRTFRIYDLFQDVGDQNSQIITDNITRYSHNQTG